MFMDIYYFLQVWAQYTRRCKVLVTLIDHSHSVCVVFLKNKNTSWIKQIDPATDCTREANSACH